MKMILCFTVAAASWVVPVTVFAGHQAPRVDVGSKNVTYAPRPKSRKTATQTPLNQRARVSSKTQQTAAETKKTTCNGPVNGSVTYPGSKKRYDLQGRRIK